MGDFQLSKDRTLCFRALGRLREVVCRSGSCWVTQAGDAADHLLGAGETLRLRRRGLVVVWAIEDSVVAFGRPRSAADEVAAACRHTDQARLAQA